MSGSHTITRRDFVKAVTAFLGTIMGAVISLPAIGYLVSPALRVQRSEAWIPLGPLENYPLGAPTLFNFTRSKTAGWVKAVNSYGVFVLRSSESQVSVLSNVCTHLSCRVAWKEDLNTYVCPCHDAQFDIEGKIIYGPQPRPLDAFETKVEDGNLFIYFVEG